MADSQSVNSEVRSSNEASEREERLRKCRELTNKEEMLKLLKKRC